MDESKIEAIAALPMKHKVGMLIASTAAGFVASTLAEKGYMAGLKYWKLRTATPAE